jgi:WD40 repeat protein
VTAIEWSPQESLLAVAAGDSLAWVDPAGFSILARSRIGPLTHGLAFTADGSLLAAASHDGWVRLWETSPSPISPEPSRAWEAHQRAANQAAFSPDGRFLATGGSDAMVRLWDLETGEVVQAIIGGTFAVPGLVFDPAGEQLWIVNGPLVRARLAAGGRMSAALHPNQPADLFSLALQAQGEWAAGGDAQGRIWLWNLPAEKEVVASGILLPDGDSPGLVWDLAFRPQGGLLAGAYGDGHVRLWELETGKLAADLAAHTRPATALAFSPDGRRLASGGLDGAVQFWSLDALAIPPP